MNKIKKLLCMLLVCVIVAAPCGLSSMASEQAEEAEPLAVEIATDKSSYSAIDIANITVTVTNTSDEAINNISAEAVMSDLAPVNKKTSVTFYEVESLQPGDSFVFSYRATLNTNKVGVGFFVKVLLWFVRIFNGGYNATSQNIEAVTENITEIKFGKYIAENVVSIKYDTPVIIDETKSIQAFSEYFEVKNDVNNINQKYEIENGYISEESIENAMNEVSEYAKQKKQQGLIQDYGVETDNHCIWITLNSGIDFIYMPNVKGIDSIGVKTYQPCLQTYSLEIQEQSKNATDGSAETVRKTVSGCNFENNYDNKNVTLEAIKNIGNNEVVIWHGHGGYSTKHHSFLQTSIELDENDFLLDPIYYLSKIGFSNDYLTGRIICTSNGYVCVTYKFFEKYLSNLKNSFVYLGACSSGKDSVLPNVFIKKGAEVVFANTGTIHTEYNLNIMEATIKKMTELSSDTELYFTAGEALANARKQYGNACCSNCSSCCTTCSKYNGEICRTETRIWGNSNYSFNGTLNGLVAESNGGSNKSLANVTVTAENNEYKTIGKTNADGKFSIKLPFGTYKISLSLDNYTSTPTTITVDENTTTQAPYIFFMKKFSSSSGDTDSEKASVHGTVIDSKSKQSISDVKVILSTDGTQKTYTTLTDATGAFSFENLPAGKYTLSFEHEGYIINETHSFTLDDGLMFVFTESFEFEKKDSSGGNTGDDSGETMEPVITVVDSGNCGSNGDNITWILYSNGELVINGNGAIMDGERGYSPFRSYSNSIKTIKISNTITSIGSYAFSDLKKLTTVNLPDSITKIGDGAFRNCKSLTDITIGSSVTSIPDYAFLGCESLVNISIPNSVTSIGYESFEDCKSLKNIIIGSGVKSIGESTHTAGCNAFANCTSLTDITVDKNNKNYSSDSGVLFNKDKTELIQYPIGNTRTTYIIPETVTSISNYAFSQCSNLTNIIIGSRVKSIEYSAFSGCNNLISVEIPNNVTTISLGAFAYCNSLTNITLGSNVATIYHNSFLNCPNLKCITVNEGNEYYSSSEGILFNYDKSELVQYPIGDTRTSYTIPDSVTTIGSSAFAHCCNLTSITIPDNVKRIDSEAFAYSSGLTEITIPSSVATIDSRAFCYCDSLISVTIGNGIINNSTTSIENYAFAWCDNLEKVIIGNNVKQIDNYAFYMCESLVDVTIGDSVTIIGENAFAWCDNLKSVTIPKSITTIGYNAFGYCDNLSDVYYTGTKSQWDNISISGSNSDLLNATIHHNS